MKQDSMAKLTWLRKTANKITSLSNVPISVERFEDNKGTFYNIQSKENVFNCDYETASRILKEVYRNTKAHLEKVKETQNGE